MIRRRKRKDDEAPAVVEVDRDAPTPASSWQAGRRSPAPQPPAEDAEEDGAVADAEASLDEPVGSAGDADDEATDEAAAEEHADDVATQVTTELPAVEVVETALPPDQGTVDREALLVVDNLFSGYGALPVLHGISFSVHEGETAVLLGLNGAGKTTTVLNIVGAIKAWNGSIFFDGHDATSWSTKKSVSNGIVMVPEGRRVFPDLSVRKNLEIGAWSQRKESGWLEHQREVVFDYFPRLRERAGQLAGTLSGGEQQMLAIGRGLMAKPRLLIIDEASLGLAPVIVKDVFDIVSQINADGTTVIMVEQNVGALSVADLGLVVEQGRVIAEVRGDELDDPARLRELFLG